MFDIKDLAGLSEPIKKLIEIVREGVGGLSRPLFTRLNADAKAYEFRTIAQAIADSQKLLGPVKYENGSISIEGSAKTDQLDLPMATLDKRVISRMAFQEAKKQTNIEHITQHATEELSNEQSICSEKPDSDWTTRFFRIAEDIPSEQMQMLWGKVLAGEVKRPGSYSLRTLDLLKNITKQEADLFVKVGQISFVGGGEVFVLNLDNGKYLLDHFGLKFDDFLLLREIGLLVGTDLEFSLEKKDLNSQSYFTCGSTGVLINRLKGLPKQGINVIVLTKIGRQLLKLVEKEPADPEYIMKFASSFRREGVTIQSGLVIEDQENQSRVINLHDVPAESGNQ